MEADVELNPKLEIYPVTPERWDDMQALFGPRGACGGCWCMYWRLPTADFKRVPGDVNRQLMQGVIEGGEAPGLLAYLPAVPPDQKPMPAGWVSIGPRAIFPRLATSRVLKPVDEAPVWSVVCFFVARQQRRQGLTLALLKAAVDYAVSQGAKIVEGYPTDPKHSRTADAFIYTGVLSTFLQAGFVEVARNSETRPIMRYFVP